jgi:hypothetical protein
MLLLPVLSLGLEVRYLVFAYEYSNLLLDPEALLVVLIYFISFALVASI